MRRSLGLLAALLVVIGCAADDYPLKGGISFAGPTTIGQPVSGVVVYLEPRPGDNFVLLGAEPIGVAPGADVAFYLSPTVIEPDGTRMVGEKLEPLAGASFAVDPHASPGPDNDLGIVATITPRVAGTFTLTGVRLRFQLNGGGEQTKEATMSFTACAADPAPASSDCETVSPTD